MRYYPNADVWFYVDKPGCWGKYQKHGPHFSWKLPNKEFTPKYMRYWRDSEGYKMPEIQRKDLYFKDMPKDRIRPQACLGMLYATGYRFIKLTRAPPAGFKCAPLPVNLEMAKLVKKDLAKKRKQAAAAAKKAKKEAKKAAAQAKADAKRREALGKPPLPPPPPPAPKED
ncbi:CG16739 [Drosophila busckii]|uniref:CG16739 n=1 Tax=Drosophila busckii TaxID=30019 RepID=A0A0M3QVE1_DROBS|nr:uncharacterized protein LOC108595806 [Drosophila busckii]ALC42259.1 CG16739 [Drosophila busckii]